uniref:Uncharacterized protein n=1 Tax=Octopus bimaculoides TaxID=37653 RepID=A0A0L8HWV9_OCTBM
MRRYEILGSGIKSSDKKFSVILEQKSLGQCTVCWGKRRGKKKAYNQYYPSLLHPYPSKF